MVLANSQGCLSIGSGVMTRARLDPGLQARSDSGKVDSDFASPDRRNCGYARDILGRRGRACGRASRLCAPLPTTSVVELHGDGRSGFSASPEVQVPCHQDGSSPSSLNFGVPRAPSRRHREGGRRLCPEVFARLCNDAEGGMGWVRSCSLDASFAKLAKTVPCFIAPSRAVRALS